MKNVFLKTLFLSSFCLMVSCADQTVPSTVNGYWNVVMAGNSTATLYFSQPVSTPIVAASSSTFFNSSYNLLVSAGASTTCQMTNTPGTVLVGGTTASNQTGTIVFNGSCINNLTSNLTISIGNSTTAVVDSLSHVIVPAGRSTSATIVPPGATGATSNNVYY